MSRGLEKRNPPGRAGFRDAAPESNRSKRAKPTALPAWAQAKATEILEASTIIGTIAAFQLEAQILSAALVDVGDLLVPSTSANRVRLAQHRLGQFRGQLLELGLESAYSLELPDDWEAVPNGWQAE